MAVTLEEAYKRYIFYLFRLCSYGNMLMQRLESLGPEFPNSDQALRMGPVKYVKGGQDLEA